MLPIVSHDEFRARLEVFESWLWSDGAAMLGMGDPARQVTTLADDVAGLSDLYTLERDALAAESRTEAALPAKVFYFLCSDAPKVYFVLRELMERYGAAATVDASRPLRVLDVGAGVGAASVGLLLALDSTRVNALALTALDVDAAALRAWRLIVGGAARVAGVSVATQAISADLAEAAAPREAMAGESRDAREPGSPFDLAIAQGVLNELFGPGETGRAAPWVRDLARYGLTIVIEPALRVTTRALQRVRDRVAADEGLHVLAPCPSPDAGAQFRGCPMLAAGERDWCHEVRLFKPTPRVAQVQAITKRRDDRCKYSFLVAGTRSLASDPLSPLRGRERDGVRASSSVLSVSDHSPENPTRSPCPLPKGEGSRAEPPLVITGRLVSDPLGSKGKTERFICTSAGEFVTLRVLDRERSASNELALTAPQGAMVRIEDTPRWPRLGPATLVTTESHATA